MTFPAAAAALLALCLVSAAAAQSTGPEIDPRLLPAWEALTTVRTRDGRDAGGIYPLILQTTGVRLEVGPRPPESVAWYDYRGRRIVVAERALDEDPRAVAAAPFWVGGVVASANSEYGCNSVRRCVAATW